MKERRVASADEMFDLLSTMANGKFATICYVSGVELKSTKRTIDMDAFGADLDGNKPEGDDVVYNQLRQYHDDDTIKNISKVDVPFSVVSVQRFNLNWASEERHNKHYSEFAKKQDEIDKRYGIYKAPEERRAGGFDTVNTHGISLGDTENTRNRAYVHQNVANARIKRELYAVNGEGNIIGKVNPAYIRSIKSKKSDSKINALRKLEKSEEEIRQYQQEIAALNFTHRKFLVDRILYIIATIDGDKFVYVNTRLTKDISNKIVINPEEFISLANELYNRDDVMTESVAARYKLVNEVVADVVRNAILKETFSRKLARQVRESLVSRMYGRRTRR